MQPRAVLVFPLVCVAACTLLNSKDDLIGPPLGDGGQPETRASEGSTGGDDGAAADGTTTDGTPGDDTSAPVDTGVMVDSSAPDTYISTLDSAPSGPTIIYSGRTSPLGIAVHSGTICWVEGQTLRSIVCAPAAGGGPVATVASQSNDPFVDQAFDVALDDNNYYWSNGSKNQVVILPRSGGTSTQYFSGDQQSVSYIVLEGTTVWASDYVSGKNSGNIVNGPFMGDQSLLVYPVEPQAAGVATYNGDVYWGLPTSVSIGPEPGNAAITRVSTPGQVTGLAIDGTGTTYFLVGNQSVYKLPFGANTATIVYSEQAAFGDSDLAVDDTAIYWSEYDNGTIVRLAK
jgi:hypothetical protein